MFKTCRSTITALTALVVAGCASASSRDGSDPGRVAGLGHGLDIPMTKATTNAKTIPATALFGSGPYDLSAKLRAYGMKSIGDDTPIWIDGTRHFGLEALSALTLDDIVQVTLVRGVWGGLAGNPAAPRDVISIITKRGREPGE